MSVFVAGIDGGQSSTIAVIGDASGRILGRGRSGGADEVGVPAGSTRLRDALEGALGAAVDAAGLPAGVPLRAVVAGVSGYDGRLLGAAPSFNTPRFVLLHDAPIAYAGALGGEPGVVVLAGTGSVVYAADGNAERTTGGWGYLFGDEGSAFWLAREALAELMRREDDGDACLRAETALVCEFFGAAALRPLARDVYAGAIGRDRLAAVAPLLLTLDAFEPIVSRGIDRLAELAGRAIAAGAAPTVACVGGLLRNPQYRDRMHARIAARQPGVALIEPRFEPAAGALLLAYREAGLAPETLRA